MICRPAWPVIILIFALCRSTQAGAPTPRQPLATVAAEDTDNGSVVLLEQGGKLTVRLASNPTTGYSWRVARMDATALRQDGEPAYAPTAPDIVGTGGFERFMFTALRAGETELVLEYVRPWEQKPADKLFHLKIRIAE